MVISNSLFAHTKCLNATFLKFQHNMIVSSLNQLARKGPGSYFMPCRSMIWCRHLVSLLLCPSGKGSRKTWTWLHRNSCKIPLSWQRCCRVATKPMSVYQVLFNLRFMRFLGVLWPFEVTSDSSTAIAIITFHNSSSKDMSFE